MKKIKVAIKKQTRKQSKPVILFFKKMINSKPIQDAGNIIKKKPVRYGIAILALTAAAVGVNQYMTRQLIEKKSAEINQRIMDRTCEINIRIGQAKAKIETKIGAKTEEINKKTEEINEAVKQIRDELASIDKKSMKKIKIKSKK